MGMEQTVNGKHLSETYWSMAEFVETAQKRGRKAKTFPAERPDFVHAESWAEIIGLATGGWSDQLPETLELVESALKTADREHMTESFNQPVWDVTGAQVDVGAYLAGTPECMIDYPLSVTSKVGRVVTLVMGTSISGSISTATIIRRGRLVVALVMTLAQLGHAVELWCDSSEYSNDDNDYTSHQRILVKAAHDEVDPAAIMFAIAHPAMHRGLVWATWDGIAQPWRKGLSHTAHRGRPKREREDSDVEQFPEGTIFFPHLHSSYDLPEADVFLREHLGNLGLLAE